MWASIDPSGNLRIIVCSVFLDIGIVGYVSIGVPESLVWPVGMVIPSVGFHWKSIIRPGEFIPAEVRETLMKKALKRPQR